MKLPLFLPLLLLVLVPPAFTSIARAADTTNSESRPIPYADVDVKPTLKKPIRVRFPGSVRKKGETPQIVLRFVVTPEGDVIRIVVVKFSDPDMIEPAMEAYDKAKFNPGMKDGQPVATLMEITEMYPAK